MFFGGDLLGGLSIFRGNLFRNDFMAFLLVAWFIGAW
jgi:hypothetical protein